MKAYVINLDSRVDRWESATKQGQRLELQLQRVSAVDITQLSETDIQFAAQGVAATWLSHRKAAYEFLSTDDEFALILEDDFQLDDNISLPSEDWLRAHKIDFLQIGFLYVTKWEKIDILFINLRDSLLKFLKSASRYSRFLNAKVSTRLLIRELPESSFKLVPSDIRPGGHCYLISRNFAASMQVLNNPIIFSADELFVSISKMRAFKMIRFKRSKVSQSDSPSSVSIRFKNN